MKNKKHLGQNFILDKNIITKISNILLKDSTRIFEVGIGKGDITKSLLDDSKIEKIIAFEIDKDLEIYHNKFEDTNRIEIFYEDFLNYSTTRNYKDWTFFSNIPYYITTKIIKKAIDMGFDNIYIMVQKEYYERMVAVTGSKQYSKLTIFINSMYKPIKLFNLKKTSFFPAPKVDSVFLMLKKKSKDEIIKIPFYYTKIVFFSRRKTLLNNLRRKISKDVLLKDEFVSKYLKKRPQEISISEHKKIYDRLKIFFSESGVL